MICHADEHYTTAHANAIGHARAFAPSHLQAPSGIGRRRRSWTHSTTSRMDVLTS